MSSAVNSVKDYGKGTLQGAGVGGAAFGPFGALVGAGAGYLGAKGQQERLNQINQQFPGGGAGSAEFFRFPQELYSPLLQTATANGPSQGAQFLTELQKLGEQEQLGKVAGDVNTAAAQAQQRLAMRGGLESGARERIAENLAKQSLFAKQAIRGAGAKERLGILSDDEKQKLALLSGLFGQRLSAFGGAQEAREQALANETGGLFNRGGFLGLGL